MVPRPAATIAGSQEQIEMTDRLERFAARSLERTVEIGHGIEL